MFLRRKNKQTGFTLVELLVTISIFAILTGIVLFNQSKFNSTILLTNWAYNVALTIRQAQTYGINIKEFDDNSRATTNDFYPYGVHLETGDNNKAIILFADISGDNNFTGDKKECVTAEGCVNRYPIKAGNYIKSICTAEVLDGDKICPGTTDVNSIDFIFKRPNPDAIIKVNGESTEYPVATIILGSVDNESVRKVEVRANGLIQIKY
jgi:prepilin-type N-terminal cleavage/methylation domain-containing protein